MRKRKLGGVVLIALLFLLIPGAAADTITSTIPGFQGGVFESGFPRPEVTIGTFLFTIPAGHEIVAASVAGFWGQDNQFTSTAGVELFVDGVEVAVCVEFAPCWQIATGILPWGFTFASPDFPLFSDGTALLTAIQTSSFAIDIGPTTLTLETRLVDEISVPEPGTMFLLGAGLVGLYVKGRQKTVRG